MRQAAALGMAALYVREASGGAGLTRLDAAVVFEALAQGCPTISAFLSIHNMVGWMIDRFGSDAQRARWLPRLIPMDVIASYCLTEPGSVKQYDAIFSIVVSRGSPCARCSSLPKLSIIHAHMLWMERNAAVATQPRESSSKIKAASWRVRPEPPCSSFT